MKKKLFSFFLAGGIVVTTLILLWQKGPETPPKKNGPTKKLSIKEEVAGLVPLLGHCSSRAEPYLYQRLQTLTGLSFGYIDGLSKAERQKVLARWVQWWDRAKGLTPSEWLSQAVLDSHYSYRPLAVVRMGQKKAFTAGIQALIQILNDPNQPADLRKEAGRTLGRWKIKDGYPQFKALLQSQEDSLILAGLYSLGKIKKGFSDVEPFLSHPHSRIREQAAQSLFTINPKKAKNKLAPLLADEELPVRMYALYALETLCSKKELLALVQQHVRDLELRKILVKKIHDR